MQKVPYNFNAQKNLDILSKGAFLTTKSGNKINTMVIGWGNVGIMWRLPIFSAMVRQNRFTYDLLEKSHEFTVTVPYVDLPQAIAICGTKSGRNMDKLAASGLTTRKSLSIATPVLDVPGMHFECSVVYSRLMGKDNLNKALNELWYNKEPNDYHMFYFGEILESYITE